MSLVALPAPKLNPAFEGFLATYKPAPSTLKWSTLATGPGGGTAGCWYEGPLSLLTQHGVELPADLVGAYAERIRLDFIDRGILDPKVLTPEFNELNGLWDHLHFGGIGLLDDLHAFGFEWAGHYATRLLASYWQNANTPWLRDPTNGKPDDTAFWFGANDRYRTAGWVLWALFHGQRIYRRAGRSDMAGACLIAIQNIVACIEKAWPMYGHYLGNGGEVSKRPHARLFMVGILGSALAAITRIDTTGRAATLLNKCRAIVWMGKRGAATWAYDITKETAEGGPPHPAESMVVGVQGVNAWMAPMLGESDRAELLADAKAAKWPAKFPLSMLHFFGEV